MAAYNTVSHLYFPSYVTESNIPFPSQRNNGPFPLVIRLLLHLCTKANRAHDPIPKFLVQHCLVCKPIILHNLIYAVYQRVLGWHIHRVTSERISCQLLFEGRVIDTQDLRKSDDVFRCGLRLAVEYGCHCDFVATHLLAYLFKGQIFGGFAFKEGVGLDREAILEGGLAES